MPKVDLNTLTSGYQSNAMLNDNMQIIEAAFDNTLSRDGTTPNSMQADIDMNSNKVINLADPVNGQDAIPKSYADANYGAAAAAAAAASAAAALASENAASASESAAAASEVAAGISETNAAASALAAQAAAQSALWRDVVFVSSNQVVTQADNGKMFVFDTAGGNRTITLPEISTLTPPFNIGVKKESSDGNTVTILRSGTDLIDGQTSKVLASPSAGTTLIADVDTSPDAWTAADFGSAGGQMMTERFNGNDVTTVFTLTNPPGSVNNCWVDIDGVSQHKDQYSINANQITFTSPPPSGTGNIEVTYGTTISVGVTADASVTLAKLDTGVINLLMPTGAVLPYAGLTAPTSWLLCYGQAVSRTTYAALFALLSTTFGAGDGSTTFNLPDLRGRVVAGQDDMGGVSADRLTGLAGGVNGDTFAATGGEEAHTNTVAEMPLHGHPTRVSQNSAGAQDATGGMMLDTANNANFVSYTGTPTATAGQQIGGEGGGGAHNNVQPTIILNYIIKI